MRGTIVLAAGFLVALATPAQAATWSPPDSGVAPVYCPQTIPVIDAVGATLGPTHQTKWYAGRNAATAEWGLPFAISSGTVPIPWTDENINSGAVQQDVAQCAIVLIRDQSTTPGDQAGWWDNNYGRGGIVVLHPWSGWWQSQVNISSIVAHEIGHALGFAHGGTGVMSGSLHVNQEELDLARAYYEALGFIF